MKISRALIERRPFEREPRRMFAEREREKDICIVKSKRDCEMDFGTIARDVQFKCWFTLGNCVGIGTIRRNRCMKTHIT